MSKINMVMTDVDQITAADAVTNLTFIDVVGNKTDAASSTANVASSIALLRYIIANLSTDAEVAALIGAIDTAAHTGVVDNVTTLMGYLKQLVVELQAADANIDLVLTDTNELQTDWTNGGRLDLIIDAILADTNELQADWVNGGRLDLILDELTTQGDTNETKIDTVDTVVDGIQTDLSNATDGLGALKALLDAIKAITDVLPDSGALTSIAQESTLGSPAGADMSTDIAVIDTVVDSVLAANRSGNTSGSFSYLDAGSEQDVIEVTTSTRMILNSVWVDAINLTNNGTFKIYTKIDGTNYREIISNSVTITGGTTEAIDLISGNMGITEDFKVTYEEAGDEGADRVIPYSLVFETKE